MKYNKQKITNFSPTLKSTEKKQFDKRFIIWALTVISGILFTGLLSVTYQFIKGMNILIHAPQELFTPKEVFLATPILILVSILVPFGYYFLIKFMLWTCKKTVLNKEEKQ